MRNQTWKVDPKRKKKKQGSYLLQTSATATLLPKASVKKKKKGKKKMKYPRNREKKTKKVHESKLERRYSKIPLPKNTQEISEPKKQHRKIYDLKWRPMNRQADPSPPYQLFDDPRAEPNKQLWGFVLCQTSECNNKISYVRWEEINPKPEDETPRETPVKERNAKEMKRSKSAATEWKELKLISG